MRRTSRSSRMTCLVKIFQGDIRDWKDYEPRKKGQVNDLLSKECEYYKLTKRLEERLGRFVHHNCHTVPLSGGYVEYLVVISVQKGSKLFDAYLAEGFVEVSR